MIGDNEMDQAREIENLKNTVDLLQRTLTEHIGGGGAKAHYRGDLYSPGFMYPEDVVKLNAGNGVREAVKDVDILTLPAGHYVGSNFSNGPVERFKESIATVDVIDGTDGKKEIYYNSTYYGTSYRLMLHTNGAEGEYSGWKIDNYGKFSDRKSTIITSKVSGSFIYSYLELPTMYLVFAEVSITTLSGADSQGVWMESAIPSFLIPYQPQQIYCVNESSPSHTITAQITKSGKLQGWHVPYLEDGAFYGSCMYIRTKNPNMIADTW